MFTKNIKLIGVVALLVVIVMVASALIAISNDNKLNENIGATIGQVEKDHDADLSSLKTELTGKIESTVKDLNGKIDALKAELNGKVDANAAEIEALKADLATLNETVATLTATLETLQGEVTDLAAIVAAQGELIEAVTGVAGAGINIDGWNDATDAYWTKLGELQEVYEDFFTVEDEHGVNVWSVVYLSWYEYDLVEEYLNDAQIALLRATDVEDMDGVIADFSAKLDSIPTRMQMLYEAIDSVEADGVTIEDLHMLVRVEGLLEGEYCYVCERYISANADELYAEDEKEALVARFDAAVVAIVDVLADEVVRLVSELPEVDMLTLAEEEVKAVEYACEVFSTWQRYYEKANDKDWYTGLNEKKYNDLEDAYNELWIGEYDRYGNIETYSYVDQLSMLEWLNTWATNIEETIASYSKTPIGCDVTTYTWLSNLEGQVEDWREFAEEITNNEVNFAMLDDSALVGYREKYDIAVSGLKAAVNAYVEVVESITHITPDSLAVLETAQEKYNAVTGLAKTFNEADIDLIIEADPEDGLFVKYSRIHAEQWKTYQTIIDLIAKIEGDINGLRVVTNADKIAKDPAVKPVYGKFDPAKADQSLVDSIEGDIWTLLATYKQVETVISADHLTVIKTARIYLAQEEARATLAAVHNSYAAYGEGTVERLVADGREAWYQNDIDLTVQSYAFVADVDHYGKFTNDYAMDKLNEYAYTNVIAKNFAAEIENKYFELENAEK